MKDENKEARKKKKKKVHFSNSHFIILFSVKMRSLREKSKKYFWIS